MSFMMLTVMEIMIAMIHKKDKNKHVIRQKQIKCLISFVTTLLTMIFFAHIVCILNDDIINCCRVCFSLFKERYIAIHLMKDAWNSKYHAAKTHNANYIDMFLLITMSPTQ